MSITQQALIARPSATFDAVLSRVSSDPLRSFGGSALPSVVARNFLAWCLAEGGDFPRAIETANEAARIARQDGQLANLIHGNMARGLTGLRMGNAALAVECLTTALEMIETANLPFYLPWIACSLGYAHALSGEPVEGIAHVEAGLERARSMNVMVHHPLWLAYLSEAYLLAGRVNDAQRTIDRALDLSITQGEEGSRAWALLIRSTVAAYHGTEPERAVSHYRDAIAAATELGLRPLLAHCHLGLGKLYRRTDKREQAQEHLTTATTMYREMGMTYWLDQVAKQLGALA
jgi:tetratricopeptide (TPR) repeat protein